MQPVKFSMKLFLIDSFNKFGNDYNDYNKMNYSLKILSKF